VTGRDHLRLKLANSSGEAPLAGTPEEIRHLDLRQQADEGRPIDE
jgi:hypothetical protein